MFRYKLRNISELFKKKLNKFHYIFFIILLLSCIYFVNAPYIVYRIIDSLSRSLIVAYKLAISLSLFFRAFNYSFYMEYKFVFQNEIISAED